MQSQRQDGPVVVLRPDVDDVPEAATSKIPDGKTATEPEMRTAMETVTQYKGDVDTYLKCLEFERKQGHMSEGQESTLHNSAVDTLQAVANKFNAQVRTFKARSG